MDTLTIPASAIRERDLVQVATEIGPLIEPQVAEEKTNRRLSQTVINTLRKAGFLKLYLPKTLGGMESDPLTTAKVVEEIARHNAAAAWSLMVANTNTIMFGRLPQQGLEEIFSEGPDTFIAGSIHPPLRAIRVDGGYKINGRNPLISNVNEAQWIFATALVMDGDQLKTTDGHPEILGIVMNAKDCRIIDTWHTLGMCATDSNDVEAKEVFVPDHLFFPLIPEFKPTKHFEGPLYRFPAAGANICCLLAPVSLGVARSAIEEVKALAGKKTPLGSSVPIRDRGVVQRKLGRAEALVQSSRMYLHGKLAECWEKVKAGETISLEEKAGLLLAAAHVNQCSVEAVDLMYSAAGTNGIYTKNKLAQHFTDSQVMRQHGFMNESRYETSGQVYLGLPPDLPIIQF